MKQFVLAVIVAGLAFSGASAQTKEETKVPKEKRVIKIEKMAKGEKRGWLGVMLRQEPGTSGVLVAEVVDGSPAETAGIKEEDRIIEFNGKKVEGVEAVTEAVRKMAPGMKSSVMVQRGDEKKSLQVVIGTMPEKHRMMAGLEIPDVPEMPDHPRIEKNIRIFRSGNDMYGVSCIDLSSQLGEYFEIPGGHGVLVEKVKRGSDAEKAGFKAGDVIVKVGKETVTNEEEFSDAMEEYKAGEKAEIDVIRKGQHKAMTLEAKSEEDHPAMFRMHSGTMPGFRPGVFGPEFEVKMRAFGEKMKHFGEEIRCEMEDGCCEEE